MYDNRVTLEQSHALEEIEKLELFIGQAEIKLSEMELQIQSGTSVSISRTLSLSPLKARSSIFNFFVGRRY